MDNKKIIGFNIVDCDHVTMHGCESLGADTGFSITGAKTLSLSDNVHIDKDVMMKLVEIEREIKVSSLEDSIKHELIAKLHDSLSVTDKKESAARYTSFISSAADHMTVLGTAWPIIAALGKLLTS
ncbi:hypothetical protein FDK32_07525 [Citrobacter freundii]|uniref:hypothetical protein n=1 Tax=Citrobacter freundii TaxID=546 RepID=UPI001BA50D63|nr:hypothetical protein [Citrobacter freundii]MBQ5147742.1 hypothetical protein [Citrobacter freundii]